MPVKQINVVRALLSRTTSPGRVVHIETMLPATPSLFVTCQEAVDFPLRKNRHGQLIEHGKRKWLSSVNSETTPDICTATEAIWLDPYQCPTGSPCNFFVGAKSPTPPIWDWHTVIKSCQDDDPPQGLAIATTPNTLLFSGAAWSVIAWSSWVNQPPLFGGGAGLILPTTGSFAVSLGTHWALFGSNQQPSLRCANQLNEPFADAPPFVDDGRPCAGSVLTVKRRPIPMGDRHVFAWAIDLRPPGDGFYRPIDKAAFVISWWPD